MSAKINTGDSGSTAKLLLYCGVAAGPVFTVVAIIEMLTRSGFDLRRHDLSLLSNGSLGWIQITNFVLAGLLTIATAVGMRRVLRSGRGRTWAPILIGIYGLGYVGAGVFVADPMNAFPPGTPDGLPTSASWHSWMHLISGSIGFIALIAACFVFARRFSGAGQRGWTAYSVATGIVVLAAVIGISSGSQSAATIIGFFVAATIGWAWLSALSAKLASELGVGHTS
jgi:Protein of unknown function (DUF998)